MPIRIVKNFLALESASGIILFVMAVIAMLWANSPYAFVQQQFIDKFLFLINEGLMAVFFLVVGLELKRGYLSGQLSQISQVILSFIAAVGGMVVPALLYYWINYANPDALKGWSTPVATDIAFALGLLSLFGKRVPPALKLFLLVLAIFDDIGAILIIAFFYTGGLAYPFLFASIVCVLILLLLNRLSVQSLIPYLCVGVLLWLALLKSGIHPTIAGVLLALTLPDSAEHSPLHRLENTLHPWVAYVIMPLFALANAGFSLHTVTIESLTSTVVLGIAIGLFVGKQIGVFLFSGLLIKLRLAVLPEQTTWLQLYGVAILCGIGFTMSLFLGTLSFANENNYLGDVRLGVIIGSLLSGFSGAIVLLIAFTKYGSPIIKE